MRQLRNKYFNRLYLNCNRNQVNSAEFTDIYLIQIVLAHGFALSLLFLVAEIAVSHK